MKPIVNIDDLKLKDFGNGAGFQAQLASLTPKIGAKQLGAMLHVVPPGKKAFPKHAHHVNEEMVFVLEGKGTWHCGEESWPVKAGDMIAAPASDGSGAHQMENTSEAALRYLCFSTRQDPDVVEYPDSEKFLVMSRGPDAAPYADPHIRYIGRAETSLDYFEGEE